MGARKLGSFDSRRSYQASDLEKAIQQTGILLHLITLAGHTGLVYTTTDTHQLTSGTG